MSLWDPFFASIVSLRQNVQDWFGATSAGHCRLYTTDEDGIIVADDASMVSVLDLHGILRLIGDEEIEDISARLVDSLKTPLSSAGHAVQIVFAYDPDTASQYIRRHFHPIMITAATLRLDLAPVLTDWAETLASYCAGEKTYIALWTRPSVMSPAELKKTRKEMSKTKGPSVSREAQAMGVTIEKMRYTHRAAVQNLQEVFKTCGYKISFLGSHDAIREIRACNAPRHTAPDWRPCLLGDPLPLRKKDAGMPGNDFTNALYPSVARQIWPTKAILRGFRYVEIGDYVFAPFLMRLPPQNIMAFNVLFRSLIGENIPWRASFLLTGDGMKGEFVKTFVSEVLAFTSASNRMLNEAVHKLRDAQIKEGSTNIGFQMSFCTWADKTQPGAAGLLAQRVARLQTAVQSWGSSDTTDLVGDPLLGLAATTPGYMPASPAPIAIGLLTDVVRMLPLARPASPWTNTELPLRTPDGRYMPVGLFSSLQASWNEICFAGMGSGKSFFLNTLNFYFCIRPGQTRLPWLTIIDIGVSSSGLINLIQTALPPESRHLAVFAQLRNTADAAINPFDAPLGCTAPLPSHQDFLINLLALLCTPLDAHAPMDGVTGLLREAIASTYKNLGPKGTSPKKYDRHAEQEIQRELDLLGVECDPQTTWWEVVEVLYDAGKLPLAVKAQRHAMPLLADIAIACNNPLIADQYRKIITKGNETVPDACSRYLNDATRDYPLLANPTRYDLGSAQIVALDLAKVTPRSGPQAERQASIMYMMARYVGAAHFFYTLSDLDLIPQKYRGYHKPRFESLVSDPKRLCLDEFHRASCADLSNPLARQVINDLTTASRESRKQNLSIGLYSQSLEDFPKEIVNLATTMYILGAGTAQDAEDIAARFGLNEAAKNTVRRITKPTGAGANFVAIFRTSYGESIQYLTNCAGSYAKWAFSTTPEDMQVRNRLYEHFGCKRALEVLVKAYPDGSIKQEVERRQTRRDFTAGEDGLDIADEIFEEIVKKTAREAGAAP